jgi:RNA polymerase sigma-70 factor (ECF subfamily)
VGDSSETGPTGPNTEQFVTLLGAHEREIFRYIYALTGNWADAQEVMQRVRIRIWQQFDQYDDEKPFGPWARAIAYYLVLAYRKERSRQKEFFSENVLDSISITFSEVADTLDDRREALLGCLEKLPSEQRQLVDNYYARNEPVASVAESLGLSSGALRQALFRIRRALQRCVERSLFAAQ